MRKSVFAICEQQRCSSACAFAQRSLISAFVVRCLDSIISLVSISEISSLYLASVAGQPGFLSHLVGNSKDGAHMITTMNIILSRQLIRLQMRRLICAFFLVA